MANMALNYGEDCLRRACPFSMGDENLAHCIGDDCAIWVQNGDYSTCAINVQVNQLVNNFFKLKSIDEAL